MDLLKTPSVQSLLDSDLESVASLQYLDIEELDEVEYALPTSEAPTLQEVLSSDDIEGAETVIKNNNYEEPPTCSALQVDFLQAISQQIKQAEERSSAGAATTLAVGGDGKITVGTAHGQLLSFHEQTLKWVCDNNIDGNGAVSCLSYNKDGSRLLAGYARGLICQYESSKGTILRQLTLGGEIWGILKVAWAATSGLALDTGGSVWLIKFSRPLGVRSARTSCIFSGARGEVVAMSARDARILALATLTRVIIVAGGRAAGLRLNGPPDTLPVLEWSEIDERVLVCARAHTLQWLSLNITGTAIGLRPIKKVDLNYIPLWLGWLGGTLTIFDSNENLRLWGDDYEKPLELSHIEPVYASAFYKGHWTDGRVSRAMWSCGEGAVAGAGVWGGALALLGRRGVVRVRVRDVRARAAAFLAAGRYLHALRLLRSARPAAEATHLAVQFLTDIAHRPYVLRDKSVADETVKLCIKFELGEELWTVLWEQCFTEKQFVEALGDAIVRGELTNMPPAPDSSQALIERLADFEPTLVERVVASLPLTSLDPHRASVFTRQRRLWRGVGAIAAAIGGWGEALRVLSAASEARCGAQCTCAAPALLLAAADALAARAPDTRPLPPERQHSARHDALHALLTECAEGRSPLRVLVEHEAASAVRLLEQCARDPPFAGPLAKHNRLRVARALLAFAKNLPEVADRAEVLDFLTGQLNASALPSDRQMIDDLLELASVTDDERGDRAWLALLNRFKTDKDFLEGQYQVAARRPRVLWRLDALLERPALALENFFKLKSPSTADIDELFDFLRSTTAKSNEVKESLRRYLPEVVKLRPRAAGALVADDREEDIATILSGNPDDTLLEFGEALREVGRLRGEAAVAHLRNMCRLRAGQVRQFLAGEAGLVRPEEALAVVRELGPRDAEPACLEAAGDPSAALDALLRLAAEDEQEGARYVIEAGELCSRVAPTVPPTLAADMWGRVVRGTADAPAALLVEALAYLPAEAALQRARGSGRVALAMAQCAARRRFEWEACARVWAREAHVGLARALCAAQRGVCVRGRCVTCGGRLGARVALRTLHCSRATHAECAAPRCCPQCGARVPDTVVTLAPRSAPLPSSDSECFDLSVTAPPRPDLEGVV